MKEQDKAEPRAQEPAPVPEARPGLDRRRFLGAVGGATVGVLAGGSAVHTFAQGAQSPRRGVLEWGPRVDVTGLKDNFAPQEVKPFTVPKGGIDNLALHSTDVFTIPGLGEFTVDFKGYFRVARANPTTHDWKTAEVRVNIIDLKLVGHHEKIGEIVVSLNPEIVSTGQILPKTAGAATSAATAGEATDDEEKACRIATAAVFDMGGLGSVFNKEPILLMNDHVRRIPPVDDPAGKALLFHLPLYSVADPHGEPVGYLTSLRYGADNYVTEAEAKVFRERRPRPHKS